MITNRLDAKFALFSLAQSFIYCAEISYTLFLYGELVHTSDDCKKLIMKIPVLNYAGKISKDIVESKKQLQYPRLI